MANGIEASSFNDSITVVDGRRSITSPRTRPGVVIMGGGRSSRRFALLEDTDYEVWGLNGKNFLCMDSQGKWRADRWFELHPVEVQTEDEMEWIRDCRLPFYMFAPRVGRDSGPPWKDENRSAPCVDPFTCGLTPTLVRYPLEEAARVGANRPPYFTCTFAYQIALAIALGFERIFLAGIDLAAGTQRERSVERACTEWWAAYAMGRGIEVETPRSLLLMQHPFLYGAEYWAEADFTIDYCAQTRQQEVAL